MEESLEEKFPEELREEEIEDLVKQGKAIFFNYVGIFPNLSGEEKSEFIKGKDNALVLRDLYSLNGHHNYRRHKADWTKEDEFQEYIFPLMKLGMDNNSQ